MAVQILKPDIFSVGARDWDRRLFDELIPLPDGTTYNAYLIKGSQKTALLDTVDPPKKHELLENLQEIGIERIDYLISHHAEQDHSGTIPAVLEQFPMAQVVTNQKCRALLQEHLLIPDEKFKIINDGEELSLGNKTLRFIFTPWVHWPETISTYLEEDKILFSCDFFGSHLATSNLFVDDESRVYRSAKRYYAEIMMPFRSNVRQNLEKVKNLAIEMIAPSHGPIYPNPEFIMEAYADWTSDSVKNIVLIPYVSMHGSTEAMVQYLTKALIEREITVQPFNLSRTDIGELAMAVVDAATVIIGSPTVILGPHPAAVSAAYLVNLLRPKTRYLTIIGSFGWGGKMPEQIKALLSGMKAEFLSPVIIKGYPKLEDFSALDRLADEIAARHRALSS
ncbi:MAG TPA: FprA family A-type flavoprotein [Candidatus Marinimicrobia bacterium]|nr:FprA family A-type flavoprotein [Candidatus Neomarinimicrobiota bacterium]HPN74691.1 FprA family A-type flavoprotein [Candidatus Neomarinimicrobiota bacterium]HQO74434.1 FprA family A-type flavoprotein [Candidatus Neomarinimicrobiota bacterium]HQQ85804.1 FprA family A-type flavoprotein [Candidatus Neomarinimicrobiota bacterium]